MKAYNSRFPTHPSFPYLKGTAVPYQKTLPNNEVHLTRIIQLDMGFPAWIKKVHQFVTFYFIFFIFFLFFPPSFSFLFLEDLVLIATTS